jgi:hypothetical protein
MVLAALVLVACVVGYGMVLVGASAPTSPPAVVASP